MSRENKVGRPPVPESEQHRRAFRVRLQDDDANLVLALAKRAGIPPNVLLRSMIRSQLPAYRLLRQAGVRIPVEADQ